MGQFSRAFPSAEALCPSLIPSTSSRIEPVYIETYLCLLLGHEHVAGLVLPSGMDVTIARQELRLLSLLDLILVKREKLPSFLLREGGACEFRDPMVDLFWPLTRIPRVNSEWRRISYSVALRVSLRGC